MVTLNQILAPAMKIQQLTGAGQPKLGWIDQIQNDELVHYPLVEVNIVEVKIDGDHASLGGQNQVRARLWGTWPLQMKIDLTKDHGRWLITNQVVSTY